MHYPQQRFGQLSPLYEEAEHDAHKTKDVVTHNMMEMSFQVSTPYSVDDTGTRRGCGFGIWIHQQDGCRYFHIQRIM